MSKIILVVLVALFSVRFTAEVFVEDKRLQKIFNSLTFVGLVLWFPISMLLVFIFGA